MRIYCKRNRANTGGLSRFVYTGNLSQTISVQIDVIRGTKIIWIDPLFLNEHEIEY